MNKPKKKEPTDIITRRGYINECAHTEREQGYNQACEEWEKWLTQVKKREIYNPLLNIKAPQGDKE